MSNWKTQKGDEWCYEGSFIRAVADLISGDCVLVVRDISPANGKVSEKALFRFFSETKEYFSEARIFIKQLRIDSSVNEVLASLQHQGLINCQMSDSQHQLVEVTSLKEGNRWFSW